MTDRTSRLEANIWKLRSAEFLRWMLFFIPVIIPFFIDKGLTLPEIFSLQAVFAITIVVLEVPSGYFADTFGRKKSILIGLGFAASALALYGIGGTYWEFLVAEILFGIGSAFRSGADHALLYDTLAELGRSEEYTGQGGRFESIARISEGIASIIGGLLATVALVLPFWISLAVTVVAIGILATLEEPRRKRHVGKHLPHLLAIFADTMHRNRALKWVILYATILGVSTRVAVWMYQPLFEQAGIGIGWFGVLWAATLFVAGAVSWVTDRIDSTIGRHRALWAMLGCSVAGYILTGLVAPIMGVSTIMLIQAARGMGRPIINDEINALAASSRRATVLSIRSLMSNVAFAAVIVGFGVIAQADLQWAFLAGGVLFGVLGALSLVVAIMHHRHND